MKNITLCLLLFGAIQLSFAQLSRNEKKVTTNIDKNTPEALELVKKIVDMNSGTMNFSGVKEVGLVLVEEFKKIGFQASFVDGSSWERAGHLVATYKGTGKGPKVKVLMIGHLDTVFEPSSPFQKHKMLNDSLMNGPGIADMKGGDVIILLALKALKETGNLDNLDIEVVMTGDEENSGDPLDLSKKHLIEAAERCDYALGFENADGRRETAVVSRRGSMGWKLEVTGNAAHSSQIFTDRVGVGAIYEASRILNEFYLQLSQEENLTFNPGFILGGTSVSLDTVQAGGSAYGKSNVVSQTVTVRGDLRAVSLEQVEKAKRIMAEIASKNYPGTSAKLTFGDGGYPPFAPQQGNFDLLNQYSKASEDLGFGKVGPVHPRNAGAADISFTSGLVKGGIDGLGLTGSRDDHTVNETGNLNNLSVQAKRAAILLMRLK